MSPIKGSVDSSDTSLSDRMDEWISRQVPKLLHTRFTQSVKYSNTCNDVDSVGFKDGVTSDATADEEEEDDHRAC